MVNRMAFSNYHTHTHARTYRHINLHTCSSGIEAQDKCQWLIVARVTDGKPAKLTIK